MPAARKNNVAARNRLRARACIVCKDGKRKCFGGYPCNRCVRLNHQCVEPKPPAPSAGEAPQEQQEEQEEEEAAEPSSPITAIEQAVINEEPSALALIAQDVAKALAARDLLHEESVAHQLRGWYALSGGLYADVTRGLFHCLCRALSIPEEEVYVTIREEANLGAVEGEPESQLIERARGLHLRRLELNSDRFAELKTFTAEDDGFTTMYMIVYWGEQGLFLAVNEVFEETFTSADRMLAMILERGLLPELLPLAWIVPEDRAEFVELLFSVLFDSRTPFHHNRVVRVALS